jgi:hypothetical protein
MLQNGPCYAILSYVMLGITCFVRVLRHTVRPTISTGSNADGNDKDAVLTVDLPPPLAILIAQVLVLVDQDCLSNALLMTLRLSTHWYLTAVLVAAVFGVMVALLMIEILTGVGRGVPY